MSLKSKGIGAERELVHLLQTHGFAAIRVAGSGSTIAPSTDILAGSGGRIFSFECKTIKNSARYFAKDQIKDFIKFSSQFGAECWMAIRFTRTPWLFLLTEDLIETHKHYAITKKQALNKGLTIQELLEIATN